MEHHSQYIIQKKQGTPRSIICVYILFLVTILTQLPIIANSLLRNLMFFLWILTAVILMLKHGLVFFGNRMRTVLILFSLLFLFHMICAFQIDIVYLNSTYKNLAISLFIAICGILASYDLNEKHMNTIFLIYVAAVLVVVFYVFTNYFGSYAEWMDQTSYQYRAKNSISTLIASAAIILFYYFKPKTKGMNALRIGMGVYMIYIMVMMRGRAALIGFCVVFAYYALLKQKKTLFSWGLALSGLAAYFVFEPLGNMIDKSMGLDRWEGDVNTLSSGRLSQVTRALERFAASPIVGTGHRSVDNLYASILVESGIIGGILFISIIIILFWYNFKVHKSFEAEHGKISELLRLLSVYGLVYSFFDGNAPVGPGVCFFLLWFVAGFKMGKMQQGDFIIQEEIERKHKYIRVRGR